MNDIYCLGFTGIPVSEDVAKILFFGAQAMFQQNECCKQIRFPCVQGEIKTEFIEGVLGSIAGYLFQANIDTEKGTTKVRYLVRQVDFEVTPPETFMFSVSPDPVTISN